MKEFQACELFIKKRSIGYEPHAIFSRDRVFGQVMAVNNDLTVAGHQNACHHFDGRGLSRAIWVASVGIWLSVASMEIQ